MRHATAPQSKVYGYYVVRFLLWISIIAFIIFPFVVSLRYAPFCFTVVASILLTAFASSRSKFAKEVTLIIRYCKKRQCSWKDYPQDLFLLKKAECEGSILLELSSYATRVIELRWEVEKYWMAKEPERERLATEKLQNVRSEFQERWDCYREVGVLPFKDVAKKSEWNTAGEFLEHISLVMYLTPLSLVRRA